MKEKYTELVQFIRQVYHAGDGDCLQLHQPVFAGNEKKYLEECIDTTFVSSVGKFVDRFEKIMAEYTGTKYAVAAVNGTAALHISLVYAGVVPHDLVITQPLSFIATCNAIRYQMADPVFVDVDTDTLGLSPAALEQFLSEETDRNSAGITIHRATGRPVRACVPMHTFGHPARIDEIRRICDEYNIVLIEDCAESIGSMYKGVHTGNFGLMGAFSFNGNKTVTTGGGGAIVTNDEAVAKRIKHLTTQAKVAHPWEFIHDMVGYNYRMPNINAALACAQMEQLDGFIQNKRHTAGLYREKCAALDISFVSEPEECRSNYWLNAILCDDREERDAFLKMSNALGVMTRPVWKLTYELPMYTDCIRTGCENAEWIADRLVNIPSSVNL